jgi:hypothetical protein
MNYDELEPGRELDALVANIIFSLDIHVPKRDEKIPGLVWFDPLRDRYDETEEGDLYFMRQDGELLRIPDYSTDIAAAWQVVEKLRDDGYIVFVEGCDDRVGITVSEVNGADIGSCWIADRGKDALAICIAALKAVEGAEDNA